MNVIVVKAIRIRTILHKKWGTGQLIRSKTLLPNMHEIEDLKLWDFEHFANFLTVGKRKLIFSKV